MADTVGEALRLGRARLQAAASPTAMLDARLLLQEVAGLSHEQVVAEPGHRLTPDEQQRYEAALARREAGEPVSRIIGRREFFGRDFRVTPAVLDPRPDTETLVDLVLRMAGELAHLRLLDLGTGSGILAVTLLAELPDAAGVACDVSAEALAVAQANAASHGVGDRLAFHHGSWFEGLDGVFDVIVSNPPYIPSADIAALAVAVKDHDPRAALDGGVDGLDPYRVIAAAARTHLRPGGVVAVEFGAGQAEAVADIFHAAGFARWGEGVDLGGHVRCAAFEVVY